MSKVQKGTRRQSGPQEENTGSAPHLKVWDNVTEFFANIADALEDGVQTLGSCK